MKARVLVVDDERIFRVMAEEALGSEGFEVTTTASLAGAKRELQRSAPDVIILDRRLPDGDGLDFLKTMTAEDLTSTLVIIVTAYADVPSAVSALQAGAVDYLTKPVQVTDLIIKLHKVLEARGLRDQLSLAKGASPRNLPEAPARAGHRRRGRVMGARRRRYSRLFTARPGTGGSGSSTRVSRRFLSSAPSTVPARL